jgi:hypothetical protein
MPKSDPPSTSEPRRSDRSAVVVGIVVALAIACAAGVTLFLVERSHHDDLAITTERVTRSIGSAVADTVGRAVGFGIPLKDLYGVDDYLSDIIRRNPEVSAIAISDDSGQTLFSVPETPTTQAKVIAVQIPVGATAVGLILVTPSQRILDVVNRTLVVTVLAASLLGGLLAAILVRAFAAERLDLRQARLVASLRSMAAGSFGDYTPVGDDSPLLPLGVALARRIAPVRREARQVSALAEEIRAIDFDATLGPRVDEALAPLEGKLRFDATHPPARRRTWKGWWAVPLLLVGSAVHPLVPSFAFDRLDPGFLQALEVAASVAAQSLGCVLGLLVALVAAERAPAPAVGLGTLLAGAATAATALIRDPTVFLALRFAAGFGLWLALWVVLLQPGFRLRRPWFWGLMVLAGLAGPGLGGLVAEAIGRRDTFAFTGVALVVLGLIVIALVERPRAAARPRFSIRPRELVTVGAVSAVAMTWLELELGTGEARYAYSELALHFCLAAAAAAAVFVVRKRIHPSLALLVAAAGPAMAVGAAMAVAAPDLVFAASAVTGLGVGLALSTVGGRVWSAEGAMSAMLGGLVATIAVAAAAWHGVGPAWTAVGLGVAGAALLLFGRPAPAHRAAAVRLATGR